MDFVEYLKDNLHRLIKPFTTAFRYDLLTYGTYREYWTSITILALTLTNVILVTLHIVR